MAKEENYLDDLLQSVIDPNGTENFDDFGLEDEDFLKSFDETFSVDDKEMDFIRQFEEELEPKDKNINKRQVELIPEEESEEDFFQNLEKILNTDNEKDGKSLIEVAREESFSATEVDILNEPSNATEVDILNEPSNATEVDVLNEPSNATEVDVLNEPSNATEVDALNEPRDISGLDLGDEFGDIGELDLLNDLEDIKELDIQNELDDIGELNASSELGDLSQPDGNGKKKKKGFFSKLFGKKEENGATPVEENIADELSSENLALLQELEAVDVQEKVKKKKEKKKKEKKAPKESKTKERKPKKEKKVKPPKIVEPQEPTKPLPKLPVILIFILCFSIVALIILGANYIGYAGQLKAANQEFSEGNYVKAYEELAGIEMKEVDKDTYSKMYIMARASQMYDFYTSFLLIEDYENALDSLLIGVKHYDTDIEQATILGVNPLLDTLLQDMERALLEHYELTLEQARTLNSMEDSTAYTTKIFEIVKVLGLAPVVEE